MTQISISKVVKRARHIGLYILMAVIAFIMLTPIFLAMFNSVKLESQILSANMTFSQGAYILIIISIFSIGLASSERILKTAL